MLKINENDSVHTSYYGILLHVCIHTCTHTPAPPHPHTHSAPLQVIINHKTAIKVENSTIKMPFPAQRRFFLQSCVVYVPVFTGCCCFEVSVLYVSDTCLDSRSVKAGAASHYELCSEIWGTPAFFHNVTWYTFWYFTPLRLSVINTTLIKGRHI